MNTLEQMQARLQEIVNQLENLGNADMTDEAIDSIEALNAEAEGLTRKIESLTKANEIKAKASTGTGRTTSPVAATVAVGVDRRTLDPRAGFKHAGEFYMAVRNAAQNKSDERLSFTNSGANSRSGEDGGFLIPVDFRTEIQKKVMGDESLIPRTRQYQTTSNMLVLPTNEVAPWDGSGVQAYWEAEGAQHSNSKSKYGSETLKLHKINSLVRVTEELLDDAPALESYLRVEAPEAILHKINSAIISGDGAGKPFGFLGSSFKYKVSKESGQAADTIKFENVNNMLGRLLPMSFGRAVWLVNPAVLPQLRLMRFVDSASSPVPVYMPSTGVAEAPFGTLFGRPILPMMGGVEALGDEGDISLVDLSYYVTAIKTSGIKSDISTHVYFETSETAFKFSTRIAGQCLYKAPVKTENGDFEMSGIVTLEDR